MGEKTGLPPIHINILGICSDTEYQMKLMKGELNNNNEGTKTIGLHLTIL